MKTQIITLESHDDLISVRDRMSWAKSPRILLVWTKFEKVELRPVDLRILQQHAVYLGADLGLVTRRGDVRRDAEGFGIPVFKSTAAAQRGAWPQPKRSLTAQFRKSEKLRLGLRAMGEAAKIREADWRSHPVVRAGFFTIGVLAVLALASLFVPRAVIHLTPISTQQVINIPVSAGTTISSVLFTGSVPAHKINVTLFGSQAAQISSHFSIPQDTAHGSVRFKNLTQSDLTIPAGTVVYSLSPNVIRFVTLNDTHLAGTANAIVEVSIKGAEAGAIGNLPANSIQAIEGSVGLSASVINPEPTSGGSNRLVIAPSADDRNRVHDVLIGLLTNQAQKSIDASIGPRDLFLTSTLKMGQVLQETYNPPAGQAGSLLNLSMRIEFSGEYVKADDLDQIVQAKMDASIPDGFVPAPKTLEYQMVGPQVMNESGVSNINIHVERTLHYAIDIQQANTLVRGLWPKTAIHVLQSRLALAKPSVIAANPSWWPWLPLIPFRITFNLE